MLSNKLGFVSSWKMMTRDKGWIKPILVLTLLGWVPILGQIAVLGYGLEWARLTAWGIDAAPKQRGVDYGKVLTTGGIAFLVNLCMSIIVAVASTLLFGTTFGVAGAFGPIGSLFSNVVALTAATGGVLFGLVGVVVNIFMSTFVLAACLRSTIYDSFSAGWRLDRLFQMVMKDPIGFLHAYAVKLIGDIIVGVYSFIVSLFGAIFVLGGMAGIMAYGYGIDHFRYDLGQHLIDSLITMGPGLVMVIVLLLIVALFFGGVLTVAMQLVSINAMGQWFCRFDVNRWGVSSAPLPDGVPSRSQSAPYGDESAPQRPVDAWQSAPQPSEAATTAVAAAPASSARVAAVANGVAAAAGTNAAMTATDAAATVAAPAVDQEAWAKTPLEAPMQTPPEIPTPAPAQVNGNEDAAPARPAIPLPPVPGTEEQADEGDAKEDAVVAKADAGEANADVDDDRLSESPIVEG